MSSNIDWNDVVKKEARGLNDENFGEVQEVSNGFVFVQKGIINKEKFFIPQDKVESYNGDVLRFGISYSEALSTYQGESYPTSSSSSSQAKSGQVTRYFRKRGDDYTVNRRKIRRSQKSCRKSNDYYKRTCNRNKNNESPSSSRRSFN